MQVPLKASTSSKGKSSSPSTDQRVQLKVWKRCSHDRGSVYINDSLFTLHGSLHVDGQLQMICSHTYNILLTYCLFTHSLFTSGIVCSHTDNQIMWGYLFTYSLVCSHTNIQIIWGLVCSHTGILIKSGMLCSQKDSVSTCGVVCFFDGLFTWCVLPLILWFTYVHLKRLWFFLQLSDRGTPIQAKKCKPTK